MKPLQKKIFLFLAVFAIGFVVTFFAIRYYIYNGGKRDIQTEEAAFSLASKDIVAEFTTNAEQATQKYSNKTIVVSGKITEIKANEIVLDETVSCILKLSPINKIGESVEIKGRLVGFDDLFGQVKLDECSIK